MKIVAIRGKNLASLEGEFMIDFTVEPLCSAGIFAITGSTGAGTVSYTHLALPATPVRTTQANRPYTGTRINGRTVQQSYPCLLYTSL